MSRTHQVAAGTALNLVQTSNTPDPQMKQPDTKPSLTKSNLLQLLMTDLLSENAPRTYCIMINALTGATCTQMMKHIGQLRRHEVTDPTLDERNEQDEDTRGQEVVDYIRDSQGFNVPMSAYKSAQILDAIRYYLYDRMHAFGEFLDASALIYTPPSVLTTKVNYDQPMSAELYMDYRIKLADQLDEKAIKAGAQRLEVEEEILRAAMKLEAARNKAYLIELKPAVLSEINSLEDNYDFDAFPSLPIELQCGIASKMAEKLDQHYVRMLPRAVRSLELVGQLKVVQAQHALVKQWLADNDEELQEAMLARAGIVSPF